MNSKYSTEAYQRAVGRLVEREVVYCVSSLIHALSQDCSGEFQDDILNICAQYDDDGESVAEAYEHWIVSDWLAEKLRSKGEMVADDIHGLTVWGRTTTGQAIMLDRVICDIYDDMGATWHLDAA